MEIGRKDPWPLPYSPYVNSPWEDGPELEAGIRKTAQFSLGELLGQLLDISALFQGSR